MYLSEPWASGDFGVDGGVLLVIVLGKQGVLPEVVPLPEPGHLGDKENCEEGPVDAVRAAGASFYI